MAAEAGQQISHAVLHTLLQQPTQWQHSHWLLTLDYTPDHPRRHAHGRLSPLECTVTPLQALAQEIARPKGLSLHNGDLLKLVAACHAQLTLRMNKQAWREMANKEAAGEDRYTSRQDGSAVCKTPGGPAASPKPSGD